MPDLKKCQGVTNSATNEPRRVCQDCERFIVRPETVEQDLIHAEAHRVTAQRWVCVNRIERVAA